MSLRTVFASILWAALAAAFSVVALGQEGGSTAVPQSRGQIKIARLAGEVFAVDHATGLKTRLSLSSLVEEGQAVQTGTNASVVLVFSNGATVTVKANSVLEVNEFLQNPFSDAFRVRDAMHEPSVSTTRLTLRQGEIVSQVKKLNRDAGSSFTVETPVGAAGIRGTAFRLGYSTHGSAAHFLLSMAEGLIRFVPVQGHAVEVGAGKQLSFNATVDPSTGAVQSLGDIGTPGTITPAEQAALQQEITDALGASFSIDFAPSLTNGAPGTPAANPTPQSATPSSGNTNTSPLAVPPPVPAAERVSPSDGEPRS